MKKRKFNWGHGIALFYTIFAAVLFTALFKSFGIDHSLVQKDYYQKDLAYENHMEKSRNALQNSIVELRKDGKTQNLEVIFKHSEDLAGEIHFYRPSNQNLDFKVPIHQFKNTFPLSDLEPGKWIVKIDWKQDEKYYYKEEVILL